MALILRLHDWRRIYWTGHRYMGARIWAYVDYGLQRER